MIYLSGQYSERLHEVSTVEPRLGLMIQPGNSYHYQVSKFQRWAADNGCFAKGDRFDADGWLSWLAELPPSWFAVAPDVIGDAVATLARSVPYFPLMGDHPIAYVSQDGATSRLIPWSEIAWLFTGGSTEWKVSTQASELAQEANRRGIPTHMGRVNSAKRTGYAAQMGYSSVDGTFLKYRPHAVYEVVGWLDWADEQEPHLPYTLR